MNSLQEGKRIDLREKRKFDFSLLSRIFSFILIFFAVIVIYGWVSFLALHSEGDIGLVYSPIYHIVWEERNPHHKTPEQLRAIYLSAWTAGDKKRLKTIIERAKEAGINALVIDVKDATGYVSFPLGGTPLAHYGTGSNRIQNVRELIEKLHNEGFYLIARIVCFQDPLYSKKHPEFAIHRRGGTIWKNRRGLSFLNPKNEEAREYLAELAKYAYQLGFDEVNFDYIRYPSDGNLWNINYELGEGETKREIIRSFAEFLHNKFHREDEGSVYIPMSADLFGFVATREEVSSIGQKLEDFFPYFDAIALMVYPSHYSQNYLGFSHPGEYPYEVIFHDMSKARERLDIFLSQRNDEKEEGEKHMPSLRTWIQDFSLRTHYTKEMIQKEIQASLDAKIDSFMVWSPNNRYTWSAYENRRRES